MNLYDLHTNPKELAYYKQRKVVPQIAYQEAEKAKSEGESPDIYRQYIKNSPMYAYRYATEIMKNVRFPEAEETLLTDPRFAIRYAFLVLDQRWPELEEVLIKNEDPMIGHYAARMFPSRWGVAEGILLRAGDLEAINNYVRAVLHGRWLSAEPLLKKDEREWDTYNTTMYDNEIDGFT